MRLVFIGSKPDSSGLVAVSLPLASMSDDTSFKQPVFRCNHLKGTVKSEAPAATSSASAAATATAAGDSAPSSPSSHDFRLEFREGGVGTFLPLFFRFLEYIRAVRRKAETDSAAWTPPAAPAPEPAPSSSSSAPPPPPPAPVWPTAAPPIEPGSALVDPSDPSKIYLTAPVSETAGPAPFGGAGWGGAPEEKKK